MTTLSVNTTTNFTGVTFSPLVDLIDFTNASGSDVTASFRIGQFDGVHISTSVVIDGSAGVNRLVIGTRASGDLDMSAFTFTNWVNFTDTITLNGGTLANKLIGSAQRDTISGDDGNDLIKGGGSSDVLLGGSGADVFVYSGNDGLSSQESIDGGSDDDTIQIDTSGTYDFSASPITSVEALKFLNTGLVATAKFSVAQLAAGNVHSITGSAGANAVEFSGGGFDLSGLSFVNWTDIADRVTINATANGTFIGTGFADHFRDVGATATFNTGAGDDLVSYLANSGISFAGDSLDGGSGFDVLELDAFATSLDLRQAIGVSGFEKLLITGSSSISVAVSFAEMADFQTIEAAASFVNLTLSASFGSNPEDLDLTGMSFVGFAAPSRTLRIEGNDGANIIKAGSTGGVINAKGGDDLVAGGHGADIMDAGDGNDTLSYAASATAVQVGLGAGSGHGGDAAGDTNTNFENLVGSSRSDRLNGDAGANVIAGGGGNDRIEGGGGGDNLDGGLGNDTLIYKSSSAGVVVDLLNNTAGSGDAASDTIKGFENLEGSRFVDGITGSDSANILKGDGGDDLIVGNGGADNLQGGAGDDTLSGNLGADILSGGAGQDFLTGGSGADVFAYASVSDSGPTAAQRDTIDDFVQGVDKIDLSAIDPIAGGADDAFAFLATAGATFTLSGPEVSFSHGVGITIIAVNTDSDLNPEMRIVLTGTIALTAADFVL